MTTEQAPLDFSMKPPPQSSTQISPGGSSSARTSPALSPPQFPSSTTFSDPRLHFPTPTFSPFTLSALLKSSTTPMELGEIHSDHTAAAFLPGLGRGFTFPPWFPQLPQTDVLEPLKSVDHFPLSTLKRRRSIVKSPSKPSPLKSVTPNSERSNSEAPETPKKTPNGSTDPKKDDAYWERRRRNNEAAKRSRDSRRAKEEEIALRATILEQENLKLRTQVQILKNETAKLHLMLFSNAQQRAAANAEA